MDENFNPAKPRTKKKKHSSATEQELNPDLLIASPTRSRNLLAEAWLVPSRLSLLVCCMED